ncbi:unnamed protein product [Aspergillus oryzae]|uniref:Unnamed protein product n=1 Tax=Aspergillus oryzae TaxID=5062 RepID=A0AAN4YMB0_ASPOZ|nr:unnamed protein product [Aspergillus oryzae]GMF91059.1 unnamed protein product [Aspergillus oryzae]GMG33017.1 unnamed protein product [Aspergillus oryzae]
MNVGLNFPDSPSPENVKWQTTWFALVSLGLAAMMQPCGNVLGQRTKNHRFYIRASPVVCAADMVQFIAFVLLGFSPDPQVWLRNVKFELRERFEGESGAKDREAAENAIIIRWILMIMGAYVFQVIKLVAMRGVPWTQAWAMMFVISILFGEILILLVHFLNLDDGSTSTPPLWRSYRFSNAVDHIGLIAISLQFAISYGSLYIFVHKMNDLLRYKGLPDYVNFTILVIFIGVSLSPSFPGYWRYNVRLFTKLLRPHDLHIYETTVPLNHGGEIGATKRYWLYSLGCFAIISFSLTPYLITQISDIVHVGVEWIWIWVVLSLNVCVILWGLANKLPMSINGKKIGRLCRVNSFSSAQSVVLCFLTFLASILCYGCVFDPSGTENPDWTGVFG